ncbi:MAG: hypothetical protein IJ784_12160 [Ruminiclostridium sp.]|nr:hypothetical protein [Ruminiclostridium sp.]
MKYRKISLIALSAALLLSGCNTDKPAATSAVTEEVTTTEATTTTTTATTTTSATTTAAPEPEKTYGIIPKEAEGVFEITAEPLLDVKAIEDKYGYDIDYDFESDPTYQRYIHIYSDRSKWEELNASHCIKTDVPIIICAYYINNEIADWLAVLSYMYFDDVEESGDFYNYVFVKDGEIVDETGIIRMSCFYADKIYGDCLFSGAYDKVFQLDLTTGEYAFLPAKDRTSIADIDDDYIIYGSQYLTIYDRHTGEITVPEPHIRWFDMESSPTVMELDRGRVIYDKPEEPGVLYYYDIKGECSGRLTGEYSPRSYRAESDEYSAVEICDDEDGLVAVEITRKFDGLTKTFDLTHLPHKYETMYLKTERSFFCGSWFLPDIMGVEAVAIDFDTEEYLPVEKNGYYEFDISRIYMKQVGSRLYGRYIDTDGEWAFGALDMTVFRENRNSDPKPPQREGVTYFLTDHIAGTAGYIGCGSDPAEVGRTPLYVGDTVAGLTITEAVTVYDRDGDEYEPCIFKARFDGRIKLKGILHRGKTEDDEFYPVIGGALMFIPYQSSLREAGLPVLHRNIPSYDGKDIEPTVYFEIGSYREEIIDTLLGDGVSAEAEVVLTDIEMHFAYSGSGYSGYSANILSTSTDAVYDVDMRTLYIPPDYNDVNVGKTVSGHSCEIIDLDENNSFFTIDNGCLFSRDMTKLCYVPYFMSEINDYIIAIGNAAEYWYSVPESVTYIAPYAICREGSWLSGIFVPSGVSDENIDELVLREGFYIAKNEPSGPPLSGSSFPDNVKRYTELFNTNADEWELLRKNVGNCGKYANEYGDILEWLHKNDGDNLEGYTFSIVSDEYQDPHFYCYKEGLPKLMIALDFWRWVKKMGPGDAEQRVPEYTMLDDTVHYDIYVYDICNDPYDDHYRKYNERYLAEANAIERRK